MGKNSKVSPLLRTQQYLPSSGAKLEELLIKTLAHGLEGFKRVSRGIFLKRFASQKKKDDR